MARTRDMVQEDFTTLIEAMKADKQWLKQILAEPWVPDARSDLEKAKRRLQVEYVTRAIQPVNARGVAYRLLSFELIESKDDFRTVVRLVKDMRVEGRLPWDWITDEGRELWMPGGHNGIAAFLRYSQRTYYRNAWNRAAMQVIICVEKAGQHGVYLPVAQEFDVPLVATEGFCSATRKHDLAELVQADRRPTILVNLGDHDDSGIEIMRDTHNWIEHLSGKPMRTMRIAVLPEHVDEFGLATRVPDEDRPHAGADARLEEIDLMNDGDVYDAGIGHFDLDALDPNVGRQMLREFLFQHLPATTLDGIRALEDIEKEQLAEIARYEPDEFRKLAEHRALVQRYLRRLP